MTNVKKSRVFKWKIAIYADLLYVGYQGSLALELVWHRIIIKSFNGRHIFLIRRDVTTIYTLFCFLSF